MYTKGDKVRLQDNREGVVYSVVRKPGRFPYDELTVKVGDELVTTLPWRVVDIDAQNEFKKYMEAEATAEKAKPETVEDQPKRRGRPPKNA